MWLLPSKAYPISAPSKGKALIISLPMCEVPWLSPLPGYFTDEHKLGELWDGIGLEVYLPSVDAETPRCLTAFVSLINCGLGNRAAKWKIKIF